MWFLDKYTRPDESEKNQNMKNEIQKLKESITVWQQVVDERDLSYDFLKNQSMEDIDKNMSISEKWEMLIFWRPLEYFKDKVYIPEELLEEKERMETQLNLKYLLMDIVDIWEKRADELKSSMWFKWLRTDDNFLEKTINDINTKIWDINVPMSDEIFNQFVAEVFDLMDSWEVVYEVIWYNDVDIVRNIFFDDTLSVEETKIKIYDQMRYRWLSGNSKDVKEKISDELLSKEEFSDVYNVLNDDNLIDIVKTWDKDWLGLLFEWINFESEEEKNDFLNNVISKYKEISIKVKELNSDPKILEQINNYRLENSQEILTKEEFIDIQISESFIVILRDMMLENKISLMPYRWDGTSYEWLYASIVWLWEKKWNDFLHIADENIDTAVDVWVSLAIWVMTMWAWSLAIRWWTMIVEWLESWAVVSKIPWLTRWLNFTSNYVIKNYPKIANWISKLNSPVWRFAWKAVLDWTAFHVWATMAWNLIFKDINKENWSKVFEWTTNPHDIMKSIVFMSVLNWLNFVSKIPWYTQITSLTSKIPTSYLTKDWVENILKASGLAVSWWVIYTISWMIDKAFWEWWNPSVKEYLEFVALIAVFKKIHN